MGSTLPDPKLFESSAATTLQEVNLQIISQAQCEASADPHRPNQAYQGRIFEDCMLCTTGGPNNTRDACAFDSGSPLLLTTTNSHVREDTVVGLVSWGQVGQIYESMYSRLLCSNSLVAISSSSISTRSSICRIVPIHSFQVRENRMPFTIVASEFFFN